MSIFERLHSKDTSLAVLGLGYVGLPLAVEFAKKFKVIGFDINKKLIESLRQGIDPAGEVDLSELDNLDLELTYDEARLDEVSFYIIAVPTPIDNNYLPELRPLLSACETVGRHIKKGDYVVVESTVYPGCTEEDCVPVIEKLSGLKACEDFKVGYSPERINPGDKVHKLTDVVKVVSGCDDEAAEQVELVYNQIIKKGVFRASTIKVAEAAKIIENTQRDVNIAIMNQLALILDKFGINTNEVIEAASTKWNFLKFKPGLVGGHCIGVDPYYLIFKAQQYGIKPQLFLSAREVNESVSKFVAHKIIKLMSKNGVNISRARVLMLGFTYKEDVKDLRNTKIADIIYELEDYGVSTDIFDPKVDREEVRYEYGFELIDKPLERNYDVVVLGVAHKEFKDYTKEYLKSLFRSKEQILVDIKGIFKDFAGDFIYWSL